MGDRSEQYRTAAAVIARAREQYGEGAAAFDYEISTGGQTAENWINSSIFHIANPHWLSEPFDPDDEARYEALKAEIASEMDAYRARCRARKYLGWSNYSSGGIRYAD